MLKQDTQEQAVVAVFETHSAAEAAIHALQRGGVALERLSIVGQDYHTEEQALGFYNTGDRMRFWGARGALWGSLWGMLFGGAFLVLPVVGPLVILGPMVAWVVAALEGAAVGGAAGALAGALGSIGIPHDSVVRYETRVKAGDFLVLAHGTPAMVERARSVLGITASRDVVVHPAREVRAA